MHRSYHEAEGKLLCLVTKSRPEICNAVRELSKHLDKPSQDHIKAANMVMNFVRNTRHRSYLVDLETGVDWVLEDYSGDNDSRLSILGYVGE